MLRKEAYPLCTIYDAEGTVVLGCGSYMPIIDHSEMRMMVTMDCSTV